jgi:hypothetical protein
MQAMTERIPTYVLRGKIQLDDAYLGREHNGGQPGRGSENMVPIVAAVSLDEPGHPIHVKVAKVEPSPLQRSRTGPRTPWHEAVR